MAAAGTSRFRLARFLDFARGNLGDHDGGTDHIGGALPTSGPRGIAYVLLRMEPESGTKHYGSGWLKADPRLTPGPPVIAPERDASGAYHYKPPITRDMRPSSPFD